MSETLACYGRRFGKLDRCEGCEERVWCAEADDPKPLTGPNAGPTGDDAAFETMGALQTAAFDWSASAGEVFGKVVTACDCKPDRIAAVCMRMCGMSYSRIGRACHKSKQAVDKDIRRISEAAPALGTAMRKTYHQNGDVLARNWHLATEYVNRIAQGRQRLYGKDGLLDQLANEFGISSPKAVWLRLRRMEWYGFVIRVPWSRRGTPRSG